MSTRKVTEAQAIAALQEFHRREGRSPTANEWRTKRLSPNQSTIVRVLGSWPSALDRAGLPRNIRYPPPVDVEQTRQALARLQAGEDAVRVAYDYGITATVLRQRISRYVASDPDERSPFTRTTGMRGHSEREDEQMSDVVRARLQRPRDA